MLTYNVLGQTKVLVIYLLQNTHQLKFLEKRIIESFFEDIYAPFQTCPIDELDAHMLSSTEITSQTTEGQLNVGKTVSGTRSYHHYKLISTLEICGVRG